MTEREILRRAAARYAECVIMAAAARHEGLDVTPQRVNRSYRRFRQWYEGRLSLGYLIRVTGVKQIRRD